MAHTEPWGGLSPLDGHHWHLRLATSELAALERDWVAVAGPHPGHELRREVIRARDLIARAGLSLDRGKRPAPGWFDRARAHMRAARRFVAVRQLALHAPWFTADRRYFS